MKKHLLTAAIITGSILSASCLNAQSELKVRQVEDGKVIKDTIFSFEEKEEAEHIMEIISLLGNKELQKKEVKNSGENIMFISDDGETVMVKKMKGDDVVWTQKEDGAKKIIVVKDGDHETFDILIDEDHEGGEHKVIRKEVRVIVEDGEEVDIEKVDIEKYLNESDLDTDVNVEVIVIKKSDKEDCDQDKDHDEDHDEEVEVKVVKKKKKK